MGSLIEEQRKQGHAVVALVHHHLKNEETSTISYKGAEIYLLKTFGNLPFVPLSWGFPSKYNKVVKDFQPDVIHLHLPNVAAFWGLFLPEAGKIPWIIHWHSDVLDNLSPRFIKLLYPLYRVFEKALLRRAKKVIATSPAYAKTSIPLKKFADKVEVVPLGLLPLPYLELPQASVSEREALKLLCVGRLSYYKGYTHLFKAISLAVQQGVDLQLEIIGGGEAREPLIRQVEQLGLAERVQLLGQVSNSVRDAKLSECDLFCLPSTSRTEAFGLVLLEAMSAGKPCLVSDVTGSGMSWVVINNKTGFVYKTGDPADLADKLSVVSENVERLAVMGLAGRKRFLELFQITVIAEKISHLYQQIQKP